MEYFDLLDDQGKLTGKKKLRAEVHKDGDWHKAVDIWVVTPKGKIVIQKRAKNKDSYPNLWEISASGHVGAGEDSITSAMRELEEELSIKTTQKDFEFLFEAKERHVTNNGTFINNEFKEVFLVERNIKLNDIKFQKEEIADVRIVTLDELETLIKYHPKTFTPHDEVYKKSFEIFRKRFHP